MGYLSRRVVPRSVRRAVHPYRTAKSSVKKAVIPRGVQGAMYEASKFVHPVSYAGSQLERALVDSVLGSPRSGTSGRRAAAGRAPAGGGAAGAAMVDRAAAVQRQAQLIHVLVRAHQIPVVEARPPLPPPPPAVDEEAIRRSVEGAALAGLSVWRRRERREAKERAAEEARAQAAAELARLQDEAARRHRLDEEEWQRLLGNDPGAVMRALHASLDRLPVGFAPLGCDGSHAFVLVRLPPPEELPDSHPDTTPGGRPTLKKWTKTEANEFYLAVMASLIVACARAAAAGVPNLSAVSVLAGVPGGSGSIETVPLYFGTFETSHIRAIDWVKADPTHAVVEIRRPADARLSLKGRTREVSPIPLGGMDKALEKALAFLRQSPSAQS